jgi:hypothetical protein
LPTTDRDFPGNSRIIPASTRKGRKIMKSGGSIPDRQANIFSNLSTPYGKRGKKKWDQW